eukprot:jgi/Psemu1/15173/gm1.15173_g
MNFSISFSTFSMVALVASTLDGSMFASAEPQLRKRATSSESNNKSAMTSDSSPSFDLLSLAPSFIAHKNGVLVLDGLNEPLTEAETAIVEEALRSVVTSVRDENFSIQEDIAEPTDEDNKEPIDDENNKRFLRTRKKNRGKHIFSDIEPCIYESGPLEGTAIPGCEFDIFKFRDNYCHNCEEDDDDYYKQVTRTPSMLPTVDPYAFLFDDFLEDDVFGNNEPSQAPSKWTYEHMDKDDDDVIPVMAPTPAPTNAVVAEKGPGQPTYRPSKSDIQMCKMLIQSGFAKVKYVPQCKFLFQKKKGGN